MRSRMIETLGCLVLMTAPTVAQAGEKLQLRTGVVATNQTFEAMTSDFLPQWLNAAVEIETPKDLSARFFVIQFKDKITTADHRSLRRLGAKPLRYIPDDAILIDGSSLIASELKSIASVQAVLPLQADWKVSSDFSPASLFSSQAQAVIVRTLDAKLSQKLSDELTVAGAKIDIVSGRAVAGFLTRAQIEVAARFEGVEWVQPAPDMQVTQAVEPQPAPDEPTPVPAPVNLYETLTGYESGTKLMNFDAAWDRGYMGGDQTIAVADTGFDSGAAETMHADLLGRLSGFVYGMFSASWGDPAGHGTHVAGSIAGSGVSSGGKIKGGASKAKLIGQSMWSPLLTNLVVPQKLADLFSQAYADGARIHSNSWGSIRNLGVYDIFAAQVDEFAFANPDFLILFAAGNSGADKDKNGRIDPGSITAPGTAKNSLTVGASENLVKEGGIQHPLIDLKGGVENWPVEPLASDTLSNNPGGLAAFSSRGPTVDGRVKPDLVAPGTNILSTKSHQGTQGLWGRFNEDYIWSGGTSMATPLVAGAAGVVREYLIKGKGLANPSAALIKNILMHTAIDLFPGQYGDIGEASGQEILTKRPTPDEGWGRVDVDRATSLASAKLVDDKIGVGLSESKTFRFKIKNARKVTASLVWTDAPASPNAARVLVNDLDLAIESSTGEKFEAQDRINNTELIFKDLAAGSYKVIVTGANVPQGLLGKQPFTLVVTAE